MTINVKQHSRSHQKVSPFLCGTNMVQEERNCHRYLHTVCALGSAAESPYKAHSISHSSSDLGSVDCRADLTSLLPDGWERNNTHLLPQRARRNCKASHSAVFGKRIVVMLHTETLISIRNAHMPFKAQLSQTPMLGMVSPSPLKTCRSKWSVVGLWAFAEVSLFPFMYLFVHHGLEQK